jgi:hypothetical protein
MIEAGVPLFLVQLVFWSHSNKRRVGTIFWLPVMLKATAVVVEKECVRLERRRFT